MGKGTNTLLCNKNVKYRSDNMPERKEAESSYFPMELKSNDLLIQFGKLLCFILWNLVTLRYQMLFLKMLVLIVKIERF